MGGGIDGVCERAESTTRKKSSRSVKREEEKRKEAVRVWCVEKRC